MHFHKSMSAETENSKFFQHSRKIRLSKIIEPRPNSNLNCLFLRCIYMSNLSWMCTTIGEIMNGNLKFLIFFQSSREISLSAIIKPWPSSKLTNAFLWHIHIFNLSWIRWGDNEWELKISFFSKLKGHNSAKNHWTMTKFELDLYFSWHINMSSLSWMCATVTKIMNGNWWWRNDRMTEQGNTICPGHYMAGA
jgi:hypothetical protein